MAIVRARDSVTAQRVAETLLEEGVQVLEVSLTTPEALRVITDVSRQANPGALIGAGTVRTLDDARRAVGAGASFLVTPAVVLGISEGVSGCPWLGGALSPSEVAQAHASGASAVKLFPASLGGPGYLKALRDPFPEISFVPVGGVALDGIADYLRAGALAVGVASPLLGDAAAGGSLQGLRARARIVAEQLEQVPTS